MNDPFVEEMAVMTSVVHEIAVDKGFWEEACNPLIVPAKLALIHSEISELLEAHRKGHGNIGEELADITIRNMDLAFFLGSNHGLEIAKKVEANRVRPYKHGGRLY